MLSRNILSFFKKYKKKIEISKGFSVVELSLILTLFSMFTVIFFSSINNTYINNLDKIKITKDRMAEIEYAIYNFRSKLGRIPCPAMPNIDWKSSYNLSYSSSNYNLYADAESITITTSNGMECYSTKGAVPTRSLGLSTDYMLDGWGRKFYYVVSSNICGNNSSTNKVCTNKTYSNNEGNIKISSTSSATTPYTNDAVYVLISFGPNGFGAYLPNGLNFSPSSTDSDEQNNYATNQNSFVSKAATNTFDDIVYYKTKNQVEAMVYDIKQNQLSIQDCIDNSLALRSIKNSLPKNIYSKDAPNTIDNVRYYLTVTEKIDNSQPVLKTCSTISYTYNCGDIVVLGLMWALQDYCQTIYSTNAFFLNSGNVIKYCPGGGSYDYNYDYCTCEDQSWDGTC